MLEFPEGLDQEGTRRILERGEMPNSLEWKQFLAESGREILSVVDFDRSLASSLEHELALGRSVAQSQQNILGWCLGHNI